MAFVQIIPEMISGLGSRTIFSGEDRTQIENLNIQLENWQGGHLKRINPCFVLFNPAAVVGADVYDKVMIHPLCWATSDHDQIRETVRAIDPKEWDKVNQGVALLKYPTSGPSLPENKTLYFDANQQRVDPLLIDHPEVQLPGGKMTR